MYYEIMQLYPAADPWAFPDICISRPVLLLHSLVSRSVYCAFLFLTTLCYFGHCIIMD